MKLSVFLAEGFEEVEALTPVDILRRAGIEVETVGVTGKTVVSSHRVPIVADITLDEFSSDNSDLIFLPGGIPGAPNLYANETVREIVRSFALNPQKHVSAICAAPSVVLGAMGLLEGKKATCYPGMEDGMIGADALPVPYVIDGNIVTGRGAGAAMDFALAICKLLLGDEKAHTVASSICYEHYIG